MVVAALGGAACAKVSPTAPKTTVPRVLGEQSGTTVVMGQPAPAGTGELSAVSCADARRCWVVGVAGPNAGTAGATGATGTTGATPTTAPATGTTGSAVTVIATTGNGGTTWTAQPLSMSPTPALTGISCPQVTQCMAVGSSGSDPGSGVVLTTDDGGSNWTPVSPPAGAIDVSSVECDGAGSCTVLASDGTAIWSAVSADFGHTWLREGSLPAGFGGTLSLSCDLNGTCLVAGFTPTTAGHGQGALAISTDNGSAWAAATVPAGTGLMQSALCISATRCLAAGTTSTTVSDVVPAKGLLLISADGGHTWTASPAVPPVDDVFGVACPAPASCVVVGTKWVGTPAVGTGAVAESRDAGATFSRVRTAYTPLTLTALACPTAEHCVAAGGDTVARITLPRPPRAEPATRSPERTGTTASVTQGSQ
jgi:collagen type I alpha